MPGLQASCITPSHFFQDQKSIAYRCLKTSATPVGCGVQKPSALHLNKVMPWGWLQGLENLANSFPNGDHNWLVLVKFHTKSQHSCSPLGRSLGSSCSQWLIQSVELGAEYIETWVLVKFRVLSLLCEGCKGSLTLLVNISLVHVSSAKLRQFSGFVLFHLLCAEIECISEVPAFMCLHFCHHKRMLWWTS